MIFGITYGSIISMFLFLFFIGCAIYGWLWDRQYKKWITGKNEKRILIGNIKL